MHVSSCLLLSPLVSSVCQVSHAISDAVSRLLWPVDLPPYICEFEFKEVEYVPPVCSYDDEDDEDGSLSYLSDGEEKDEEAVDDTSYDIPSDEDDDDVPQSPVQPRVHFYKKIENAFRFFSPPRSWSPTWSRSWSRRRSRTCSGR